jgi:hypothetical protein
MTSYDLLALGKCHTNMIINQDPLLTQIFYRSGPEKIYQMIHSMDLLIQDLLSAIIKLSYFFPKGLLRIFKDPLVPPFEDSPALSLPLKIITQHCPLSYSLVSNLLNIQYIIYPSSSVNRTLTIIISHFCYSITNPGGFL